MPWTAIFVRGWPSDFMDMWASCVLFLKEVPLISSSVSMTTLFQRLTRVRALASTDFFFRALYKAVVKTRGARFVIE